MRSLFFALLLSTAALSQTAAVQTLAVASIETRGGLPDTLASEMNDAIVGQLVKSDRLHVVERQQVSKVMKEQALSMSGVISDETQIKVAQLLGARFIAVGAVAPSGASLNLSLRAMDSTTAQVLFAESLTVGGQEQVAAGSRQLARKLEDKLAGPGAQASGEIVGDFDTAQVKDAARGLARSLAMRFPKLAGRVVEALPDGSLSCNFGALHPFAGQFFEIDGKDEVTGQLGKKGYFLLKDVTSGACSGKAKSDPGAALGKGDQLNSLPLRIDLVALEPGAGTQPQLANLLSDELRAALAFVPNFKLSPEPQLTVQGRVSGPRGQRTVELQAVDKGGNVVQTFEVPATF